MGRFGSLAQLPASPSRKTLARLASRATLRPSASVVRVSSGHAEARGLPEAASEEDAATGAAAYVRTDGSMRTLLLLKMAVCSGCSVALIGPQGMPGTTLLRALSRAMPEVVPLFVRLGAVTREALLGMLGARLLRYSRSTYAAPPGKRLVVFVAGAHVDDAVAEPGTADVLALLAELASGAGVTVGCGFGAATLANGRTPSEADGWASSEPPLRCVMLQRVHVVLAVEVAATQPAGSAPVGRGALAAHGPAKSASQASARGQSLDGGMPALRHTWTGLACEDGWRRLWATKWPALGEYVQAAHIVRGAPPTPEDESSIARAHAAAFLEAYGRQVALATGESANVDGLQATLEALADASLDLVRAARVRFATASADELVSLSLADVRGLWLRLRAVRTPFLTASLLAALWLAEARHAFVLRVPDQADRRWLARQLHAAVRARLRRTRAEIEAVLGSAVLACLPAAEQGDAGAAPGEASRAGAPGAHDASSAVSEDEDEDDAAGGANNGTGEASGQAASAVETPAVLRARFGRLQYKLHEREHVAGFFAVAARRLVEASWHVTSAELRAARARRLDGLDLRATVLSRARSVVRADAAAGAGAGAGAGRDEADEADGASVEAAMMGLDLSDRATLDALCDVQRALMRTPTAHAALVGDAHVRRTALLTLVCAASGMRLIGGPAHGDARSYDELLREAVVSAGLDDVATVLYLSADALRQAGEASAGWLVTALHALVRGDSLPVVLSRSELGRLAGLHGSAASESEVEARTQRNLRVVLSMGCASGLSAAGPPSSPLAASLLALARAVGRGDRGTVLCLAPSSLRTDEAEDEDDEDEDDAPSSSSTSSTSSSSSSTSSNGGGGGGGDLRVKVVGEAEGGDLADQYIAVVARACAGLTSRAAELAPRALACARAVFERAPFGSVLEPALAASSFGSLVSVLCALLSELSKHMRTQASEHIQALTGFAKAKAEVEAARREVDSLRPKVSEEATERAALQSRLANDEARRRKLGDAIAEDEVWLAQTHAAVDIEQRAIASEMGRAEPVLAAALAGIDALTPGDLIVVRETARPTDADVLVMEMLCVLHGISAPSWRDALTLVGAGNEVALLDWLRASAPAKFSVEQTDRVQRMMAFEAYRPATLELAASRAVCAWIVAVLGWREAARIVKPRQAHVASLQAELHDRQRDYEARKADYDEVSRRLDRIRLELTAIAQTTVTNAASELASNFEEQARLLAELEPAVQLLSSLVTELEARKTTLLGDCVLAAALANFGAGLVRTEQRVLLRSWGRVLHDQSLLHSDLTHDADVDAFCARLLLPHAVQLGLESALPRAARTPLGADPLVVSSQAVLSGLALMRLTDRVPLVRDGDDIGSACLVRYLSAVQAVQADTSDPGLAKQLKRAMLRGRPIVVRVHAPFALPDALSWVLATRPPFVHVRLADEDVFPAAGFRLVLVTLDVTSVLPVPLADAVRVIRLETTHEAVCAYFSWAMAQAVMPRELGQLRELQAKLLAERAAFAEAHREVADVLRASGGLFGDEAGSRARGAVRGMAEARENYRRLFEASRAHATALSERTGRVAARLAALYAALVRLRPAHWAYRVTLEGMGRLLAERLAGVRGADEPDQISLGVFAALARGLRADDVSLAALLMLVLETSALGAAELDLLVWGSRWRGPWQRILMADDADPAPAAARDGAGGPLDSKPKEAWLTRETWRVICMLEDTAPEFAGLRRSLHRETDAWYAFMHAPSAVHSVTLPAQLRALSPVRLAVAVRVLRPGDFWLAAQAAVHAQLGERWLHRPAVVPVVGREPLLVLTDGAEDVIEWIWHASAAAAPEAPAGAAGAASAASAASAAGAAGAAGAASADPNGAAAITSAGGSSPTVTALAGTPVGTAAAAAAAAAASAAAADDDDDDERAARTPTAVTAPASAMGGTVVIRAAQNDAAACALLADELRQCMQSGAWFVLLDVERGRAACESVARVLVGPGWAARHAGFRCLFLASADADDGGVTDWLVSLCRVLMWDTTTSVKARLMQSQALLGREESLSGSPSTPSAKKVFFALNLLHASLQARTAFGPVGFVGGARFPLSNLASLSRSVKRVVDVRCDASTFDELAELCLTFLLGGVCDGIDRFVVTSLVERVMADSVLDPKHMFSPTSLAYKPPVDLSANQLADYLDSLPASAPPDLCGLSNKAVVIPNVYRSLRGLLVLQQLDAACALRAVSEARALNLSRMAILSCVRHLCGRIPVSLEAKGSFTQAAYDDVLASETALCNRMLAVIADDLDALARVCEGQAELSVRTDMLWSALSRAKVPSWWACACPSPYWHASALAGWTERVLAQTGFLNGWLASGLPASVPVGLLHNPSQLLSAVLVGAALASGLEDALDVFGFEFVVQRPGYRYAELPPRGVYLTGLALEGGVWDAASKVVTDTGGSATSSAASSTGAGAGGVTPVAAAAMATDGAADEQPMLATPHMLGNEHVLRGPLPAIWAKPVDTSHTNQDGATYSCPVFRTSYRRSAPAELAAELSVEAVERLGSQQLLLYIDLPISGHSKFWAERGLAVITE